MWGMGPFRWGGQEVNVEKRWKAMRMRMPWDLWGWRESGTGCVSRRRCKGPEEHGLFQKADPGVEKEGLGSKG